MEKIDIAFIGGSGLYKIPNFKKVLHGTLAPCPERNVFKLNLIVEKVYWLINVSTETPFS